MSARPLPAASVAHSLGPLVPRALALFIGADAAVFLRYAIKDWPRPWLHILGENNTVTWLSSVQLSLIGWLAIALGLVMGLHRAGRPPIWQRLGWFGLGIAFLALSADEALQIHERLDVAFTLPGFQAGDGILLFVAVAGALGACILLLPQLLISPAALRLFAGACGVAILSQVGDVLDLSRLTAMAPALVKWTEMAEEGLELLAQVGFIVALTTLLTIHLGRLGAGPVVPPRHHRGPARSLLSFR